jgi:hypothetical protein
VEEEKIQSPRLVQPSNPPAGHSSSKNTTFGYDNELLLANGIEPAILLELPEELRAELLSTIDLPVPSQ